MFDLDVVADNPELYLILFLICFCAIGVFTILNKKNYGRK